MVIKTTGGKAMKATQTEFFAENRREIVKLRILDMSRILRDKGLICQADYHTMRDKGDFMSTRIPRATMPNGSTLFYDGSGCWRLEGEFCKKDKKEIARWRKAHCWRWKDLGKRSRY
jgi:uncharacterized protein YggL (DUF469 family)